MRISDWSSDVCSSDLKIPARETLRYARAHPLVELEAAWRGDRFRQELAEDLARALVRAYERRSLDDETSRRAVVEDARLCVERSEEHTSELQSLMRISSAVFCLKKKQKHQTTIKK